MGKDNKTYRNRIDMSDFLKRIIDDFPVPPKGPPNVIDLRNPPSKNKGFARTVKPTDTE